MSEYTERLNRAGIPVWRPAQPATGREDEHQTALTQWARMMRTQYPALRRDGDRGLPAHAGH